MSHDDRPRLMTPIYLKTDGEAKPPDGEPISYVLAGNGLFIHREHPLFSSCVRTQDWPSELAEQKPYLVLRCPKLPRVSMERIVGFFARIADLHGSEAAAILFWDRSDNSVRFEIPEQRATVNEGWNGELFPSDVRYETPRVGSELSLFGSIHSHVYMPAYSSAVDREDESYLTGLHIVVGCLDREPPDVHCEYVVDGVRFRVDTRMVIEGYGRRSTDVPDEWIERVKVDLRRYETRTTYYDGYYGQEHSRPKRVS